MRRVRDIITNGNCLLEKIFADRQVIKTFIDKELFCTYNEDTKFIDYLIIYLLIKIRNKLNQKKKG